MSDWWWQASAQSELNVVRTELSCTQVCRTSIDLLLTLVPVDAVGTQCYENRDAECKDGA